VNSPLRSAFVVAALLLSMSYGLAAQVSWDRLIQAAAEPQNWLTYSGTYSGQRYSLLRQIDPANVKNLEMKWILQGQVIGSWEASPLVVDGIMYLTQRPNDVVALDARTGRIFWIYRYAGSPDYKVCCGANNRGLAILGDTLFMGTLDAHLVALDARNGRLLWNVNVAEFAHGYSVSLAPLVVKDKVIIGVGGGEYGIRGFVAAYDAATGKEAWRFNTIPGPGEPGSETWSGDAWKSGGGSIWVTGSYDPVLNLTYWGVGNPGPDFNPAQRPGDNLYTDSVIALDADTGKLKWHFQFTPNDPYDWDSTQVPVLALGGGRERILFANRNGFLYSVERASGKFQWAKAFVKQTWLESMSPEGRPTRRKEAVPSLEGTVIYPSVEGATNWWPPSYDAPRDVFYVPYMERGSMYYLGQEEEPEPAALYMLGSSKGISGELFYTGIRAFRAADGELLWEQRNPQRDDIPETNGLVATAGGVVFGADLDRVFAVDAATGKEVWQFMSGGRIASAPMSYAVNGKQYVALTSQRVIVAFELPPE
jgi:alcohol dehydrogenase (cytochrome c)